ncbi:MAG TPA: DUF1326 domain-containing protein [Anaeromyxobacteraceae bacterium]|nr:DUF1326 domain-containing protein [Anaeromyxobacteraceae bacterium]
MTMRKAAAIFTIGLLPLTALGGGSAFDAKGKYYETCACAVSCPCGTNEFLPTEGHCDAVMLFHLTHATVGMTKMDGLNFAVVLKSPNNQKVMDAMNKGEMDHFAIYLDDRATKDQQAAFPKLLAGMFGKMEVKNAKAPAFATISLVAGGDTAKIDIGGGKLVADLVNIKVGESKTGGKTVARRIKLDGVTPFPWVMNVTQGKSVTFHYADGDTHWDYKDRNAFFGDFSTKGTVVVASN